ncbi:MAG: 4Fe-4S dicluster domain-containing protein [Deltaproteobacteria bacterium]|nr:4Fe-4S dicluster domain-containing protein [Deltaproteobacteria bacterium]
MADGRRGNIKKEKADFSRRDFLKLTKNIAVGAGVAGILPSMIWLEDGVAAIPVSEGYLLVDTKKCQGCVSCMLACSLVHEGEENLSLARIQVIQNSFEEYPDDITLSQCRQCTEPACMEACPTGALHVDTKHGNIRTINEEECIGCQECVKACPFMPARAIFDDKKEKALKCDLCVDTPFWSEPGGPGGKQACVEVCPVGAIKFTDVVPEQKGDGGYVVNLRGRSWRRLGYPRD